MSEIRSTVLIIYFNSITPDVGPSRVGQYYIALKQVPIISWACSIGNVDTRGVLSHPSNNDDDCHIMGWTETA